MRNTTRSPWLATPLIAAIAFLGIMGLEVMIDIGGWLRTPAFIMLVATLAVVTTRLLSHRRALPTLVGGMVAVVAMVPVFAVSEDGGHHVFPTPGALSDLGAALRGGVEHAATTVAPAPASLAFTSLITAAMIVLFLIAEHVAVSWRAGATAGLLLLTPWMPAVALQHRVSTTVLLGSIALWLIVLTLTRKTSPSERTPAVGGALIATTATLGAVLLVAPIALGGPGWGMLPRFDVPGAADGSTRLNLALDLRTSLTARSTSPVMVYTTTGARPDAFKLYSLADFDGVQWARREAELPDTPSSAGVLWPTPIDGWNDRERTRLEMQVLDLQETNLPLPPTPRSVDIDGSWFYDPERDEVVGRDVTARDARYAVETDPTLPERDSLMTTPAGADDTDTDLDPRYLALSPAIDTARVESLAQEVTADASTRYEQALALQSFFRTASEFTYDTSVDPTGGDAVNTFLNDREGYCVQFATAMVVMARTLDIPARMAVGFLPGMVTDQGSYVVQGGDAHAWPELWFPGNGWVRFEPTPAVQTGAPPSYADPLVNQAPGSNLPAPGTIPDFVPGNPTAPDSPGDTGPGMPAPPAQNQATVPLWAWVAIGMTLIAIALGGWAWRRRIAAKSSHREGPEAEWESLRDALPESLQWGRNLTPHEAAEHVTRAMRAQRVLASSMSAGASRSSERGSRNARSVALGEANVGSDDNDRAKAEAAEDAMTKLAHAVEDHRYAPSGLASDTAQLRAWAHTVADYASTLPATNLARQ